MSSRSSITRSTSARRTVLGLGAVLTSVCTLAACGSHPAGSASGSPSASATGSGSRSPATALSAAATATARAKSARMTLAEDSAVGGRTQTTRAEGLTGLSGGSADRSSFTLTATGRRTPMRVIGTTLYEKLPDNATTRRLSGGKLWIKVNVAALAHRTDLTADQVPDATQQLGYLDRAQKVTEIGRQSVGGVPTTHYRAMVTPLKAGDAAGAPTLAPVDVWVDAQDHIRQEKVVLSSPGATTSPSSSPSSGASGTHGRITITTTLRLSDFGTAVHVSAPPAGQVTEVPAQPGKGDADHSG